MGIFSLQLWCPGSSSPIQTASDCSLHRDQNFPEKVSLRKSHWFVPKIHASQPSSCHHSIREHSSHHQTWNRQWKNRPHDTIVQILCVCELVSVSGGFTDQMNQCSTFSLVRTFRTLGTCGSYFGLSVSLIFLALSFVSTLGP